MLSRVDPTLCIYGDSHLAGIKLALNEKRIDPGAVQIEFWGADGPQFREIHMVDGRMTPTTDAASARVALINANGRKDIGANDFGQYLFVGGRLRSHEYIAPMLNRLRDDIGFLSRAVRLRVLTRWLNGCRSYRTAREFAQSGGARVLFAPASFLNDQVVRESDVAREINENATAEDRGVVWDEMSEAMAADGVELLRQPEITVTRGCLTKLDYAANRVIENRDTVHKNGTYGALVLGEALTRLQLT